MKRIEGGQDGILYISKRYWQIIGGSGGNGRQWGVGCGARTAEIDGDSGDISGGERIEKN
jgi:hypothetical protein